MGNSNDKIQTLQISPSSLAVSSPPIPSKYTPPFRKFSEVLRKKHSNNKVTYIVGVS